jgi:predicted PurR-regulated permease PerM
VTDPKTENTQNPQAPESPPWNWTTKLIVGLALVALAIWLLVQFQNFLGPIITAFVLAYLVHPIAFFLKKKIKIPWRLSVTIVFIFLIVALLGLLTWGGFALVDQIQKMIRFITSNIDQLPALVEELTTQTYHIGPFTLSPLGLDWDQITSEIVSAIQPILGSLGSFVGSFAAGAASTISIIVVIMLIAYFLLAEAEGISHQLLSVKGGSFSKDLEHINLELSRVWNAFIRGEIVIMFISMLIYTATLGILGVQFFFGLSIVAAIGQLIPYLGAWITWISFGLVALFQNTTPFNLPSGIYMLIVLAISMLVNNIIDNIIRTKVMSQSLRVHPVLVLIGALVGVRLLGFIGIVIAAPIMASISLFTRYVVKKLNDQDPWEGLEIREPIKKAKWVLFLENVWEKVKNWFRKLWQRVSRKTAEGVQKRKLVKTKKTKNNPKE